MQTNFGQNQKPDLWWIGEGTLLNIHPTSPPSFPQSEIM
jgi:hypothetical protein